MAEPSFGLTGESRRADHQKSAPQEKPLPGHFANPKGNGGHFKGKRGPGNTRGDGK